MKKSKIESILPLTFMQKALLFHSLSGQEDQGFLHVETTLKGSIDKMKLQEAWENSVKRHEVLRASIHWDNLEKPLQVIHPDVSIPWTFKDWSMKPAEEQEKLLVEFIAQDRKQGLNLSKVPVNRFTLIQFEKEKHLLLWTCHHILLDGWSATNIIKDAFAYYDAICKEASIRLEPIPSAKAYLKELQSFKEAVSKSFWENMMKGYSDAVLLNPALNNNVKETAFDFITLTIPAESSQQIKNVARENRVTLNTFMQGLWTILLSKYTNKEDIAFGTTVSVRSRYLDNAALMAGLFTNMLPVRIKMEKELDFTTWLLEIQKQQSKVQNHNHVTLDQIISWMDWPGYLPLFDNLLIVENFPWTDFKSGGLMVQNFKGGITTTYPLTTIVKPLESLEFTFQYNPNVIPKRTIDWILKNLNQLVNIIISNPKQLISEIYEAIGPSSLKEETRQLVNNKIEQKLRSSVVPLSVVQPNSSLELQLIGIWENTFGRTDISVTDNFFEIGGKSILAVRLFAQIEKQLSYNLPPVTLLQQPTIRGLAQLINKGVSDTWKSLIPIQTRGTKKPLFCLHAKGGHVFFYNALAGYLGENQPVYALQPKGLDGVEPLYESIEEMAKSYIDEIRTIQAEGPYSLLATCFSNAVGLEMAQQLKTMGQEISLLAMVDAAPGKSYSFLNADNKDSLLTRVIRNLKEKPLLDNGKKIIKKLRKLSDKGKELKMSKQERSLLKVQQSLDLIFKKYERKHYNGKITLIRSSEFSERTDKAYHVEGWNDIVSEQNLEIFIVPGHHSTLFIEPEVQGLAKQLSQCLENSNFAL